MTDEEKHIIFKKIATRFLKEAGLLNIWKEYLKHNERFQKKCWYEGCYIEDIFGSVAFTSFIEQKINKKLPFLVMNVFISYCKLNGFDKYISPNRLVSIVNEKAILNSCFKMDGSIKYVQIA